MSSPVLGGEQLLSVKQVAAYLNVSPITVRRMIANHTLPATRVGWQLRVRQEDLDAYLERHRR